MYIKRIQIQNFRSIVNQDLEPSSLNLIVGDNDIGKSNILRALNLFFNDETSFGQKFNFRQDFAKNAITPKKKAPEIRIILHFASPASYKENREIIWTKKWRAHGLHIDEKKYSDGTELEGKRKVGFWLDQLRFRYVPAIKGPFYFSELLRDLHDVLAQTISAELRQASSGFVDQIRSQTDQVSIDLFKKLGFESKLQIPEDLSTLFQILEFETTSDNNNISLDYRGDGIKVRHIPIILKFIAEQENANKKKGSPKINTIWGYEEPENNLELTKAFEKADELLEYSSFIQIFATTHSPAFYSLARDNKNVHAYFVHRDDNQNTALHVVKSDDLSEIDIEMGLLPLITPHIKDVVKEKQELLNQVESLKATIDEFNTNVLFVEGPSDKVIIEKAFTLLRPGKSLNFSVACSSAFGGGHSWVKDMLISWHYNREKRNRNLKAAGLFDFDNGSKANYVKVNEIPDLKNVKVLKLQSVIPQHLIDIVSLKLIFPYAIEEFFPERILKHAEESGWLEPKSDLLDYNIFRDATRSFNDFVDSLGLSQGQRLYLHKIKEDNKKNFSDYVVSNSIAKKSNFNGLEKLVKSIEDYFK